MFWTLVAGYMLLGIILAVAVLWAMSKLWKRKAGLGRCIAVVLVMQTIALAAVMVQTGPGPGVLSGVLVFACLVFTLTFTKWATRARWGRATVVFLSFFAVNVVAQGALVLGVGHQVMHAYRVPTGAMSPTINPGDRILADKISPIQRWDVIVFRAPIDPKTNFVKRLIGLPGETVEIVDEGIKINGSLIPKPPHLTWLHHNGTMKRDGAGAPGHGCTGNPITLAADEFYVLGDNTELSLDSRLWGSPVEPGPQPGTVPRKYIHGIARLIYAPSNRTHLFER